MLLCMKRMVQDRQANISIHIYMISLTKKNGITIPKGKTVSFLFSNKYF